MIYVGLDDTDIIGSPGTNQLALAIARELAARYDVVRIVRHQLFFDPRVPYTSRNGSASIVLRGRARRETDVRSLAEELKPIVVAWCPSGSDPGLCVAAEVGESVISFGRRTQGEIVTQREAHQVASSASVVLFGLGGTEGGVIGALAAVGLTATEDDGRILFLGSAATDISEIGGMRSIAELLQAGVERVLVQKTHELLEEGTVDVGKKLRPNLRGGRTVLYVAPQEEGDLGDGDQCAPGRLATDKPVVYRALKVY